MNDRIEINAIISEVAKEIQNIGLHIHYVDATWFTVTKKYSITHVETVAHVFFQNNQVRFRSRTLEEFVIEYADPSFPEVIYKSLDDERD